MTLKNYQKRVIKNGIFTSVASLRDQYCSRDDILVNFQIMFTSVIRVFSFSLHGANVKDDKFSTPARESKIE